MFTVVQFTVANEKQPNSPTLHISRNVVNVCILAKQEWTSLFTTAWKDLAIKGSKPGMESQTPTVSSHVESENLVLEKSRGKQ